MIRIPFFSRKKGTKRSRKLCVPMVDKLVYIFGYRISLLSLISYILDWLLYGIIALVATVIYNSEPLFQEFSLIDRRIMFTYYPEVILMSPIWALIIFSISVPIIMGIISSVASIWKWPRKLWDGHIFALGLIGALSMQFLITSILKNATGKPRPDFLHRCLPHPFTPPLGTLANIAICSNPDLFIVWEGYRSFPSGHATSIPLLYTIL